MDSSRFKLNKIRSRLSKEEIIENKICDSDGVLVRVLHTNMESSYQIYQLTNMVASPILGT